MVAVGNGTVAEGWEPRRLHSGTFGGKRVSTSKQTLGVESRAGDWVLEVRNERARGWG